MSVRTVCEIVVVPASLVLLGYLLLHWANGEWWGIALWIVLAPLVYLLVDRILFGAGQAVASGIRESLLRSPPPRPHSARRAPESVRPKTDWGGVKNVSTGAEILRRGRRYDRRRA